MPPAARKKKRKKQAPKSSRPPFAAGYPVDAELDRLIVAFNLGNYAAVRSGSEQLAARTDDEGVRAAARDLRRRLDAEPTAIYLWVLGVALSIVIYIFYVMHR